MISEKFSNIKTLLTRILEKLQEQDTLIKPSDALVSILHYIQLMTDSDITDFANINQKIAFRRFSQTIPKTRYGDLSSLQFKTSLFEDMKLLQEDGLLWEIEKYGKKSYLFATFHSSNLTLLEEVDKVREVIKDCKRVATEIDTQKEGSLFIPYLKLPQGITLSSLLNDKKLIDRLKKLITQLNLRIDAFEELTPAGLMLTIASCLVTIPGKENIDNRVFKIAQEQTKEMTYLETGDHSITKELLLITTGLTFDVETQIKRLNDFVDNFDGIDLYNKSTSCAYKEHSLKELIRAAQKLCDKSDSQPQFLYFAIDLRNQLFFEKMVPLIEKGDAFIGVGASHLPGLIKLLKANNCQVTCHSLMRAETSLSPKP